ncbi:unnamed protein product [Closterium sp. Naga37s-1]|nr:unnamed protein product [Closterium sp. Naga37s-1]
MVARRIPPVAHSAVPSPLPVSSHTHCAPAAARAKHRPAARVPALPCGALCPSSIRPFPHPPPPPSLSPLFFPQYLTSSSSYFLSPSAAARSSLWRALPFPQSAPSPSSSSPLSHYCFLLLMATSLALPSLPLLVLQLAPDGSAVNFPSWLNCLERTLSGTLVSGSNLWFVTQQSGYGAIPTSPSGPTSSSSDPYADDLRAAIAETERLVTTAQATATPAPNNAAARDLACILAESLESTRKRLTEHLAAPSPRSASTPISSTPSHSDLLADWHVANARACQVILACLPPTLLPQCSHIRYAKDLLGYLTERFQSQTPISVIALLRELCQTYMI